ncbi:MAG: Ig-like domain-containing protein [Pleurocapsa sp.]
MMMLNKIFYKLCRISFFSAIAIGSIIVNPALSNASSVPVGIDSLETRDVNAESSSGNVCDRDNNCNTKEYGTGTNIKLNGFTVDGKDYSILQLVDEARFQRVDNSNVSGERHIYFLETGSNDSIGSSAIFTMEDAVRSDFINGGTDNVFANNGGTNLNNIERVDFIIKSGLIVKDGFEDKAGFLLLERGGNDPFKIAAITGVDANGNPSQFGSLIDLPKSTWGNSGINIKTSVLQNQSDWNAPKLTASLGGQKIHGIFVSIASLGIDSGDTVYGYALFPGDISSNSDLVGLSDFPKNTSAASGQGGLDLISSGGLFIPNDVSSETVFKPASAIDDEITTDEDNSVTGNVLTNDLGDNLEVITTGQQTLSSGALVTIYSNGIFEYDPNSKFELLNENQVGTDTFSYTMEDGSGNVSSASVTVSIDGITDTFPD